MSILHAPLTIKHKHQLLPALLRGEKMLFADPSVFSPRDIFTPEMGIGTSFTCTNHPKRTWFAVVTRKSETEWEVR